ncbi:MAG: branched-chain amino acid ABC transporter permease, partial [Deltaproteobacteria bacterium]|nr:branched-chain amino acid ABC transporter permease [Deltaproteobacteria bacterium]
MSNKSYIYLGLLGAGVICLFLAPILLSEAQIMIATEILYFSLFAVSFNLLFGYGGLLPFGHGGLFGVGAYATALILSHFTGFNVLLCVILSGAVAFVGGGFIGFFALRLKGTFFALMTFAFQMFLFALAFKWRPLTGGEDGIGVLRPDLHLPLFGDISLASGGEFYIFALIVILAALALCYWLLHTPFGNTITCIKVNEERATFLGYRTYLSQLILFCFASFMAGIAGSIYTLASEYVSLEAVNVDMSFTAIMITFIGGSGAFLGPALGAGFYVIFQDWLSNLTDRWLLFMGVLFVLMVLYMDGGL